MEFQQLTDGGMDILIVRYSVGSEKRETLSIDGKYL